MADETTPGPRPEGSAPGPDDGSDVTGPDATGPDTTGYDALQTHEIGNRTYIVADVDPLDVDGVRTVAVGTVLWGVAFVLLLPFYGQLEQSGRLWWLWTCAAGFGLGIIGWDYCRRRRNAKRAGRQPLL